MRAMRHGATATKARAMANRKTLYIGPIVVIGLCVALVMLAWEKVRGRW